MRNYFFATSVFLLFALMPAENAIAQSVIGTLTLVKEVVGGTAVETDWTLSADGPTPITNVLSGTETEVGVGDYALSESFGPGGYTPNDWACPGATVTNGSVAVGVDESITCTITNTFVGEISTLTLVNDVTVNEGDGTAILIVTRSGDVSEVAAVDYSTVDGSASDQNSADYVARSGTLNWHAGDSTSREIIVSITDDLIIESEEVFTVNLSNATGSVIDKDVGLVTIEDNDYLNALSIDDVTVKEIEGTAVFTVTRENSDQSPLSVSWQTFDGSANAADFVLQSGELNWSQGDSSQSRKVEIGIRQDCEDSEPEETFTLLLSNAIGETEVTLKKDQGKATIIDVPDHIMGSSFEQMQSYLIRPSIESIDLDTGRIETACIPEDVLPDFCAIPPDFRFELIDGGIVVIIYPQNNVYTRQHRHIKGRHVNLVGPTDVRQSCLETDLETKPLTRNDTLIIQTDKNNWYKMGEFIFYPLGGIGFVTQKLPLTAPIQEP